MVLETQGHHDVETLENRLIFLLINGSMNELSVSNTTHPREKISISHFRNPNYLTFDIFFISCFNCFHLRSCLELKSVKYYMSCLISLDTFSRIIEKFIKSSTLTLLHGIMIQDLVSCVTRVIGIDS